MNPGTPRLWKVSELILAYETRENLTQAIRKPAAFLVCEKLRPSLASLMGHTGFRTLLSRALAISNTEAAWPGTVQVKADGTLAGWDALERQIPRKDFAQVSVVLIACLLGLLVAFIGEELTLQLLREIWPELTLNADPITTEENK